KDGRVRRDTYVDRPRALAVRPAPRLGRGARAGDATAIRGGTRTSPRTLAGRAAGTTRGRAAARPRAALPAAGRVGGVAATERVVTRLGTLAAIILLVPAVGFAHGLDPASLALRETRAGVFEVRWRASALRLPGANVQPVVHRSCAAEPLGRGARLRHARHRAHPHRPRSPPLRLRAAAPRLCLAPAREDDHGVHARAQPHPVRCRAALRERPLAPRRGP